MEVQIEGSSKDF